MRTLKYLIPLTVLIISTSALSSIDAAEEDITVLLNCAVIIGNTGGNITRYDEYVIAASYLAVDNGKSMEWLNGKIERAFEAADEFSREKGAAKRCVSALNEHRN
jgi:uncharacterized protein with ACT and thioredoxin-like domain